MRFLPILCTVLVSLSSFADDRKRVICEKIIQKSKPPLTVIDGAPSDGKFVHECIKLGKFSFSTNYDVATNEENFTYVRKFKRLDGSQHSTLSCSGYIRFYIDDDIRVKKLQCQVRD